MSEEDPNIIQRILVALDASPQSQVALDAAVRLATHFDVEIEGLFVEDETLLRTARLPFAEEVRSYTTAPKYLSDRRIERQLRYQAEYAERMLQHAAEQADVPSNFQVLEGHVTEVLLKTVTKTDLLALGKTSTDSSRRRLGSTSRTVLTEASAHVLVLREAVPSQQPIVVYYDGSAAAPSALSLAAELATGGEVPLTVLVPAHDETATDRLRNEVRSVCDLLDVPVSIHPLSLPETRRLSAFARRNGGLVILPSGCSPLTSVPIQQFLYEVDRPLLIAR